MVGLVPAQSLERIGHPKKEQEQAFALWLSEACKFH
jgi:hypothetical protein